MDYSFLRSRAVAQAAQAGAVALAVAAVPTHYRGLQVIRVILAGDSESSLAGGWILAVWTSNTHSPTRHSGTHQWHWQTQAGLINGVAPAPIGYGRT